MKRMTNAETQDRRDYLSIHDVIAYVDIPGLEALLGVGVNVNHLDSYHSTPLMACIFCPIPHGKQKLNLLLNKKARVNIQNKGGSTALHYAATFDRRGCVRLLLQNGAIPHFANDLGQTALYAAVEYGNREIVEYLLDAGALVNGCSDIAGSEPLFAAVYNGRTELIPLLQGRDATMDPRDAYGRTPLTWSIERGKTKNVEALLGCGIDPTAAVDAENGTALHYTACFGNIEIAELLISHRADPNAKDDKGHTPLDFAVAHVKGTRETEKEGHTCIYPTTSSEPLANFIEYFMDTMHTKMGCNRPRVVIDT